MFLDLTLAAANPDPTMTDYIMCSALMLGVVGIIFGIVLGWAKKAFHIDKDPRVEQIELTLPGANCGGCGFPGCSGYANAVVHQGVNPALCAPGGPSCGIRVAKIMGMEMTHKDPVCAMIHCNGHKVATRFEYNGVKDCRSAHALQSGFKACPYGCLGLGTCYDNCPFDAIAMGEDGFPVIIESKCVACGKCVSVCPRNLIGLHRLKNIAHVLCMSREKGKDTMEKCEVGCIGCMKCKKVCPADAVVVENFLSRIVYDKCISCGKCVEVCPTSAIGNFSKRRGIALTPVPAAPAAPTAPGEVTN